MTQTLHDDGITLRRLQSLADYEEACAIQDETWGAEFSGRVPVPILLVAQKIGGVTAGAFTADGRMVGLVFGLTGVRNGRLVHWSDLLAVRPEAQGRRLGERLKQYQRELVLAIGVNTMLWTFDPLVARNAHLNLNRLGARAAEYATNLYGSNTGSVLHGAAPTDRFIVEWDLAGNPDIRGEPSCAEDELGTLVNPTSPDGEPRLAPLIDSPTVRIEIPADIHALTSRDPALALRWRETTREAFVNYLARGYRVTRFCRASGDQRPSYQLTSPQPGTVR
jgi:chorismate synthase